PLVGATVGTVTTCGLGAAGMTGDSGADRDGRLGGVVTPTTAEATEVLAVSNTDIVVGRSTLSGTDTGAPTLVEYSAPPSAGAGVPLMPPVTITSGSGTTDDGCPSSGSVNPNCPSSGSVNPNGLVAVTLIGLIVLVPVAPGLLGDSGTSVDWL